MAKNLFYFGISFAIVSSTVASAILATSNDGYDMMTAIVVFNATDVKTNTSERLGSTDPHDEIGKYGKSSPVENVRGLVQLAALRDDHNYGCKTPYQHVKVAGPWIALIERGQCTFTQKIVEAKLANASGVIIFDYDNGVLVMKHDDEDDIVAVSISNDVGQSVLQRINAGRVVTVSISRGHPYVDLYGRGNKTSIIFVSLSFLILMIISLTWLIVYYVQRFRLVRTPDLLKQRRAQARRIVNNLPKKLLKEGDKEIGNEEICPICIETYKVEEILRILPCKHIYHRKCVDPWLRLRETCPMCKLDVMKSRGLMPSPYDANFIFGTRTTAVEIWEPDRTQNEATTSNSIDSLVQSTEFQASTVVAVVEDEDKEDEMSSDVTQSPSSPNPDDLPGLETTSLQG